MMLLSEHLFIMCGPCACLTKVVQLGLNKRRQEKAKEKHHLGVLVYYCYQYLHPLLRASSWLSVIDGTGQKDAETSCDGSYGNGRERERERDRLMGYIGRSEGNAAS